MTAHNYAILGIEYNSGECIETLASAHPLKIYGISAIAGFSVFQLVEVIDPTCMKDGSDSGRTEES
jgi:hypothetical protein